MRFLTFGEVMARFAPDGAYRFIQAMPGKVNVNFTGAEANVAVSLSHFGASVSHLTVLPEHEIADACLASMRTFGIDTSLVRRSDKGRLGLFYLETGANQRPSKVVYDRSGTSFAIAPPEEYDWNSILNGFTWLHVTGITPALSLQAAEATQAAVETARKLGVTVSMDLNFRKKLWAWDPAVSPRSLAEKTIRRILPSVDVLVANESDCADVLDIHANDSDAERGTLSIGAYPAVAREVSEQFPNMKKIAITLRESVSATHNNWGAMLYDTERKRACFGPVDDHSNYKPYEIRSIVDRVGAGDSFAAALIFALSDPFLREPETAVRFAAASSCLAHSIHGDYNHVSRSEVESLMHGNASGRVQR